MVWSFYNREHGKTTLEANYVEGQAGRLYLSLLYTKQFLLAWFVAERVILRPFGVLSTKGIVESGVFRKIVKRTTVRASQDLLELEDERLWGMLMLMLGAYLMHFVYQLTGYSFAVSLTSACPLLSFNHVGPKFFVYGYGALLLSPPPLPSQHRYALSLAEIP